MNNFNYLILIIIFITIVEGFAQSCVKKYYLSDKKVYFCLGIFFYAIICYLLTLTYRYEDMGIANAIWSGLSIIMILFCGTSIFKETIHLHDIFAIILILGGIFIFKYTK